MNSDRTESLADYVLRVMREKDLSQMKVSERAKAEGFSIAQSYINKITSNAAGELTVPKIEALAKGLGRPFEEVLAVYRGDRLVEEKINDALANAAFSGYPKLGKKDKEALTPLLRALQREIDERLEKQNN